LKREDGTGDVRVLHRNLFLPLRTRILEELPAPPTEPDDCIQAGNMADPIQEDQEDSSEDEQDSDNSVDGGDESVSTRPWTRRQGAPQVLVDTQPLSKCSVNAAPSLLQEQRGTMIEECLGYTERIFKWATSSWEGLYPWPTM